MTELQMGILGFGVAAIIVVLAYNKWQEYRHRKLVEKVLKKSHTDVLFDSAPVSLPVSSNEIAQTAENKQESSASFEGAHDEFEKVEPIVSDTAHADYSPDPEESASVFEPITKPDNGQCVAASSHEHREHSGETDYSQLPAMNLLQPDVDFISVFQSSSAMPLRLLFDVINELKGRVSKPILAVGLDRNESAWVSLDASSHIQCFDLCIGLQLADRNGSVSEAELDVFSEAMNSLALQLGATVTTPPQKAYLSIAQQLDTFCADVDVQIGVSVVATAQPFTGTKLRALAEAGGFTLDQQGRFVRTDEEGRVLYILLNADGKGFKADAMKTLTTPAVTFLLDLPKIANGERIFNQMFDQAKRFSDVLKGVLVDDNRKPLLPASIEPIHRQISSYQTRMAEQNILAGSPVALRLFS